MLQEKDLFFVTFKTHHTVMVCHNGKCQNVTSGLFGRESLDTLRRSPDEVSRESVRVTIRLGSFPVRNLLAAPICDLEKAAFLRQGGSLVGPERTDDRWS